MDEFLKGICQHCGGGIEFPAEAVGARIACPHCQRETVLKPGALEELKAMLPEAEPVAAAAPSPDEEMSPLRRMARRVGIIALVLLATLVVLDFSAKYLSRLKRRQDVAGKQLDAKAAHALTGELAVLAYSLERPAGSRLAYVTGVATNRTTNQYRSVTVEFELLSAAGQRVEATADSIAVLDKQRAWVFRAAVSNQAAAKARLRRIQGEINK